VLYRAVRLVGRKWERGKKTDLKNCSRWPKTEYVRPYSCRCVGVCVRDTFELVQASSNACV
jgi:hypothetical protein